MLEDLDLSAKVEKIVFEVIGDFLQTHPKRSPHQLRRYILDNFTYEFKKIPEDLLLASDTQIEDLLFLIFKKEMKKKARIVQTHEGMSEFYRLAVLKAIDEAWIEEVDTLQQLKGVITTRSTAQKGSVSEYYKESLRSYKEMTRQIQQKIVRNIMLSTIEVDKEGRFSIYFV